MAPPKRGLWYAEPKLNGWRALIHTPTGTMWNRHGALLTIAECFRPALAALAKLASRGIVWADCEALERRHNLGRGTLVVLDAVPESERRMRHAGMRVRIAALRELGPALFLILCVLGSMYGGIATPTEAAALGVVEIGRAHV